MNKQLRLWGSVPRIKLKYSPDPFITEKPQIQKSQDAYDVLKANWDEDIGLVEEFNLLHLDNRGRVLAFSNASKGGMDGTFVDLRVVFAGAILNRAMGIILAHNHPSGTLQPSKADMVLTERFKNAGAILNIKVLDHIILAPNDTYYSMADAGLL